jgi:hypothetical protein
LVTVEGIVILPVYAGVLATTATSVAITPVVGSVEYFIPPTVNSYPQACVARQRQRIATVASLFAIARKPVRGLFGADWVDLFFISKTIYSVVYI